MSPLVPLLGGITGISLGLTGGGGTLLAVPLLVMGLGMPMTQAVPVSLAAVGLVAASGVIQRLRSPGELRLGMGIFFAIAGMAGAPLGAYFSKLLPPLWLMGSFAVLMVVVALRMWRALPPAPLPTAGPDCEVPANSHANEPACRSSPRGVLQLTRRCAWLLAIAGFGSGVLSGMLGVGGGFVIVPALLYISDLRLRDAVGTSLLVVAAVALAGLLGHHMQGDDPAWDVTLIFSLGGALGMALGTRLARQWDGTVLRRIFAVALILVACSAVIRTVHTTFYAGAAS